MSIYTKARAKVTIGTVLISLSVIVGAWLFLFGVDYIMYVNDRPILFGTTRIEDINGVRVITESGLGYYVIINGEETSELYVFGHKIK